LTVNKNHSYSHAGNYWNLLPLPVYVKLRSWSIGGLHLTLSLYIQCQPLLLKQENLFVKTATCNFQGSRDFLQAPFQWQKGWGFGWQMQGEQLWFWWPKMGQQRAAPFFRRVSHDRFYTCKHWAVLQGFWAWTKALGHLHGANKLGRLGSWKLKKILYTRALQTLPSREVIL